MTRFCNLKIAVSMVLLTVILTGCGTGTSNSVAEKSVSSESSAALNNVQQDTICADYPYYNDLKELADASDLVVRCRFTGHESCTYDGLPCTKMSIEVSEVLYGQEPSQNNLYFIQVGTNEEEKPVFCDEYISMQSDTDYVLFLSGSDTDDAYFLTSPSESCYYWNADGSKLEDAANSGIALAISLADIKAL